MVAYGYATEVTAAVTFVTAVIADDGTYGAVPVLRKGLEKSKPRTGPFIIVAVDYSDTSNPLVKGAAGYASQMKRMRGQVVCKILDDQDDGGVRADEICDALAEGIEARADVSGHPWSTIDPTRRIGAAPSTEFPGLWQVNAITPFERDAA